MQEHCRAKYSVQAEEVMQRRDVLIYALHNEEQVMRRDTHRLWRWRIGYSLGARAVAKAEKAPGGRSPVTPEVLQALPWQTVMDLDVLFKRLYENVAEPMPDFWRVLCLKMLPMVQNAQELQKFRGISLIGAVAKFYTFALTRLLRSDLAAVAPAEFHRPLIFGFEMGAAAEQIGVGLSALFQRSCDWQIGDV